MTKYEKIQKAMDDGKIVVIDGFTVLDICDNSLDYTITTECGKKFKFTEESLGWAAIGVYTFSEEL